MEKRVLVSVIMPTYNCGKYIAESIESVIAQTETDWEMQIVDDCSTDNSMEIISKYVNKYPNKIFCTQLITNGGPAVARTEAIRRAKGKYIAFLDCDDVWKPEKLERQISFMRHTGASFSATAYEQMNEEGTSKNIALFPPEKCNYKKMLRLSNPIGNTTVIYDQEALGKYEVPRIRKRNDFALWLKILKDCTYCYGLQEVLASYRVRSDSISSNKLKQAKYHWYLYRKLEGMNMVKSVWYVCCWAWVKGTGIGIDRRNF